MQERAMRFALKAIWPKKITTHLATRSGLDNFTLIIVHIIKVKPSSPDLCYDDQGHNAALRCHMTNVLYCMHREMNGIHDKCVHLNSSSCYQGSANKYEVRKLP